MACNVTKCSQPECNVHMKACQLINGKCPACYEKSKLPPITPPKP